MGTGMPSPAQSCPRFKCDREKRQVKAPLSPSRSPEASRMVFTVSSLPFCPLGVSSYQRPPLSYACKPRFSLGPSPEPDITPIPPEKSFSAPRWLSSYQLCSHLTSRSKFLHKDTTSYVRPTIST